MSRLLKGLLPMKADSRNSHLAAAWYNFKLARTFLAEARQTGVLLAAALDQNHRLITLLQADVDGLATILRVHSNAACEQDAGC